MNKKTVEVTIDSNPQGADIYVEGKSYGRTPAVISLEPKTTTVSLVKAGYGSGQMQLESWQAIRTSPGEGGRCLADAIGTMFILPALSYWSIYCRDFKQPRYSINIPYQGPIAGGSSYNNGYDNNGTTSQQFNPYQYNQNFQQQQGTGQPLGRPMNSGTNNPYQGY